MGAQAALKTSATKTCTKCGETKPLGGFYRSRTARLGVQSWCKICVNAQVRQRKTSLKIAGDRPVMPGFVVPEVSPERMAELARQLESLSPRQLRCRTCRQRFLANVGRYGSGGLPWCPRCIDKRVQRVLAARP